jgi:AraC-like DNA-binding protein
MMQMSFSVQDINTLFEALGQKAESTTFAEDYQQRLQFSSELSDGWMQRYKLRQGLEVVLESIHLCSSLVQEIEYGSDFPAIAISFCLAGQTQIKINSLDQSFNLGCGQGILSVPGSYCGVMTIAYTSEQRHAFITFYIEPKTLYNLIGDRFAQLPNYLQQMITGEDPAPYFQPCAMNAAMWMAAEQVWSCPYQMLTRQLYLEAKAIELIALYFQECTTEMKSVSKYSALRSGDIDRIYQAKNILIQQIDNPPSLIELAKQVRLNDYKLKLGFRQVFGKTVFGYLRDYRMQQAKQLLDQDTMTIAEVAYAVGFANRGRFAAAFKQAYGINPHIYIAEKRSTRSQHP